MEDFDDLSFGVDVCNDILYHTIYPALGITWEDSGDCAVYFMAMFETDSDSWRITCDGIVVCDQDERHEYTSFLIFNKRSVVGLATYLEAHILRLMIKMNFEPRIKDVVRAKYHKILNRYLTLRRYHAGC